MPVPCHFAFCLSARLGIKADHVVKAMLLSCPRSRRLTKAPAPKAKCAKDWQKPLWHHLLRPSDRAKKTSETSVSQPSRRFPMMIYVAEPGPGKVNVERCPRSYGAKTDRSQGTP